MRQSIVYIRGSAGALVRRWQRRLGIETFTARLTPIDPLQVTGEDGRPGAELVGVVIEGARFTVVHTRPLDESDVVHELLHVAHPDWPHELVELWTDRLLLIAGGELDRGVEHAREGSQRLQPAHAQAVHDHPA